MFLQQQLERVLAFMRTVDARLDALERTSHHLLEQNDRLTKQLSQQQRATAPPAPAAHAGVSGGVCPLCGVHFADSHELQAHASVCLDKREQRHASSGGTGSGGGLFGRVLGKH